MRVLNDNIYALLAIGFINATDDIPIAAEDDDEGEEGTLILIARDRLAEDVEMRG